MARVRVASRWLCSKLYHDALFLDVSAVQLPVEELLYSGLDNAARAVVCISGGYVYRDWARQYCI